MNTMMKTVATRMAGSTSPYAQIGLAIVRSLGLQRGRWLWFWVASIVCIMVVGGGIALQWRWVALQGAAVAVLSVSLPIIWIVLSATLMRLNTPSATRTVPRYAQHLRQVALASWLGMCLLTGLLEGASLGSIFFHAWIAGAWALFIVSARRWFFQWCFVCGALVFAGRHSFEIVESPLFKALAVPSGLWIAGCFFYGVMAWLVTRIITPKGSRYATVLSQALAQTHALPSSDGANKLSAELFGPIGVALSNGWHRLQFPWRWYLHRVLAIPPSPSQPQPRQTLARALLGLGSGVHWVMQLCAALVLWSIAGAVMIFQGGITGGWALLVGLAGLMAALLPTMSLSEVLRQSAVEQKLMLLLPGMPHGAQLNRLLALRHLRHAFVAWLLAAAIGLTLPYPPKVVPLIGGLYLSALVCLPFVVANWACIKMPTAVRSLGWLLTGLVAPALGAAGFYWLDLPASAVVALAPIGCAALLVLRWSRLPHYPQAFPAGRLG